MLGWRAALAVKVSIEGNANGASFGIQRGCTAPPFGFPTADEGPAALGVGGATW
jgi:hypothetical protein